MTLSPQQKLALKRLAPIARIATDGTRTGLPILARTHSLMIGPSGSGKSFLAKQIGVHLGIPTLAINVATWVIIAARSEPCTLSVIAQWLDRLPEGGVLILDEVDKLQSESEWTKYVRLEVHDLLDGTLPEAVKIPVEDANQKKSNDGQAQQSLKEILSTRLRERVMVIGCGAWQAAWRSNSKAMGFSENNNNFLKTPPTREQILQSIDPELRQRFRDEVTLLPPMLPDDYLAVARELVKRIPEDVRPEWKRELGAALRNAVEGSLGMRSFEELLLKALILSGRGNDPKTPPKKQFLKPIRDLPEPESIW